MPQAETATATTTTTNAQIPKGANAPFCPRFVVLGATGVGKSTLLNRLSCSLNTKRGDFFEEGAGAESETDMPNEMMGNFLGTPGTPCFFVDMPGLNASGGASVDTRHIKESATFLRTLKDPVVHNFILVINFGDPRMSASIRNMLETFNSVFDPTGKGHFLNYISLVFTKVPFYSIMLEDNDEGLEVAVASKRFAELKRKTLDSLARDWAINLAAVLGHENDFDAIESLAARAIFVDSKMRKSTMNQLVQYGYNMQQYLQDLYQVAKQAASKPFLLTEINTDVKSKLDSLASDTANHIEARQLAETKQKEILAESEVRVDEIANSHVRRLVQIREDADIRAVQLVAQHNAQVHEINKETLVTALVASHVTDRLEAKEKALLSGGNDVCIGHDNENMRSLRHALKCNAGVEHFMKKFGLRPIDRPFWKDLGGKVAGVLIATAATAGLLTDAVASADMIPYGLEHLERPSVLQYALKRRLQSVKVLQAWDYD